MAKAFVFPGQGSQAVGMGVELKAGFAAAREVFEEVDEALGQNLSRLMAEGPIETLTLTENAQPALMAVSLAALRVLEKEGGLSLPAKVAFVAGHSLGEYCALAAAGTFALADAARLLRARGQAMQKAVPAGEGAMCALLGAELDQASALASQLLPGVVAQPTATPQVFVDQEYKVDIELEAPAGISDEQLRQRFVETYVSLAQAKYGAGTRVNTNVPPTYFGGAPQKTGDGANGAVKYRATLQGRVQVPQ